MSSNELLRLIAGITVAILALAPLFTSAHLFMASACDLATVCRALCSRLKVSSMVLVAISITLCATVLGLCWELKSLFGLFIAWLYMLMAAYTFIFLPLGILLSRRNGGRLPMSYQPVRLFFATAAIPIAIPTFIAIFILMGLFTGLALGGVLGALASLFLHL